MIKNGFFLKISGSILYELWMGKFFSPSYEYLLVSLFFLAMLASNIFGLTLYSKIARKSVRGDDDPKESRRQQQMAAFSDVVITATSQSKYKDI